MGALAYFVLSGQVLFPGRTPMQMLAAHMYEMPKTMDQLGVSVPAELETLIFRCLAKQPAERFADIASLESALQQSQLTAKWTEREARDWWKSISFIPRPR